MADQTKHATYRVVRHTGIWDTKVDQHQLYFSQERHGLPPDAVDKAIDAKRKKSHDHDKWFGGEHGKPLR